MHGRGSWESCLGSKCTGGAGDAVMKYPSFATMVLFRQRIQSLSLMTNTDLPSLKSWEYFSSQSSDESLHRANSAWDRTKQARIMENTVLCGKPTCTT